MREAFEIMIYGMGGIFAAILIIMAFTSLFKKIDSIQ